VSALSIAERVKLVQERVATACRRSGRSPDDVTIIAVTKGFSAEVVLEVIAAGITNIGENRVQEAESKLGEVGVAPGVIWHMIGHLQTNKVKTALGLFDIIHSVDSLHLAEAISRRASRPVPVFLQVNVAGEASKAGLSLGDLAGSARAIGSLPHVGMRGLMTVAPLVDDPEHVRPVFTRLREEADALGLRELSMGMSDDFEVAVEEGATHVRLGRVLFGERE
jgi:PLP dependent protein